MKKIKLVAFLLLFSLVAKAQIKPDQIWLDSKYSMFIHFGLYSKLGGVWNGQPVKDGYSEQIQSFAGIFSDWYGYTAYAFNPDKWNADSIVSLAKKAGMRSIVFTSKHHDGFCMYHSQYTDFNIVDATPFGRDVMKELSNACLKAGIRFSVYFSLIDWHFPEAYPISSHNADPLTDAHYQYNLKQVEEIMTNYGKISEIWFDMGSLTPEQSQGLYALVNRLQPSCMISGRLGNNAADFSVLADNEYPEYKIGAPWQTAASMFDETWGYRSWQERGKVGDKVKEKLRSLIKVVSRGGNYLLNIGPDGEGAVVPFERDVLLSMGDWISRYAEAIYGTRSNPFDHSFQWGDVTRKDKAMYLFLYDKPKGNVIKLDGIRGKIDEVTAMQNKSDLRHSFRKGSLSIMLPDTFKLDSVASVIKIAFDDNFTLAPAHLVADRNLLPDDATKVFGYSALDYYCGFKSLIGYDWNFAGRMSSVEPKIYYTDNEVGRKVSLTIDGKTNVYTLGKSNPTIEYADETAVRWGNAYTVRGGGIFGNVPFEGRGIIDVEKGKIKWNKIEGYRPGKLETRFALPFQSEFMLVEINASRDLNYPVKVIAGNSAYVLLNGEYISAEFSDKRPDRSEKLLVLPLKKGLNQILIKTYNRYSKSFTLGLQSVDSWNVYRFDCEKVNTVVEREHTVELRADDRISKMVPMSLENIRIEY